ncbi:MULTISPECIES: peptide chain release factor 1 [unclassified Gemella]|uniref:peptide chain release factor 1 n=1 Tax=unclassified Gemella TaxID=2624949 RepID=UPI0010731F9A|nr:MULTISPECIES: peptide chain release factor 1 [unclassified Gemella]MBF0710094.1 peptide chain release factor 1 [Gemella sp. GL1.1]MBF0746173.1 peptide chain release factor 1 [Gemella sp. 19428wG2_WT2a]NYS27438.1 peptide chain release factor 1 [Gemella sp. GL1]TFU60458.1 peptide chain release factor 1 [Gemella sp. WT2a]
MEILNQLEIVEERYEKLNELLSDPDIVSNTKKLMELSKEQRSIEKTVTVFREYKSIVKQIEETKELLEIEEDKDMKEMMQEELKELEPSLAPLEEELKILLLPKDPNDSKNVVVEVRGAAGGDEAALFAGDLLRMYTRYAESQGWKVDILERSEIGIGGVKEATFVVSGEEVYSKMKFESGAHRVQRVPSTESSGRIHTSTATVVVLPEVEEVEVDINENDIRVDTFASSGAGGQSVNTTMSAVRLTHMPTGVVVSMQDERSQIKNKEKAMKILRARVYDMFQQQEQAKHDAERKSKVGTGDRSERIRTYNYPQNRLTDHRIGLTIQKLDQIMEGKLDEVMEALRIAEQTEKMAELNKGDEL